MGDSGDAGTKVLTVENFQRLRRMLRLEELMMSEEKIEEKKEEKSEEKREELMRLRSPELKRALQTIVVAVQLMSVKAVEEGNEQMEASSFSLFDLVLIYTLVVILITVMS